MPGRKMSSTTIHKDLWRHMHYRCEDPKSSAWPKYGGRGISVCPEWGDFNKFMADMGERPTPLHTLDRIDNSGNYCRENCRWTDKTTQARNRGLNKNSSTGFRGVAFHSQIGRWRAYIVVAHRQISLGTYLDIEDAITAREAGEIKYWKEGVK